MGWTKRQFIEQALDEIGIAPFTYELTSEQLSSALRRLDTMMAQWNSQGLRLGYPLPASPGNSSLDEASGVPDSANEAIILNLAVRLSASYGKQLMPQTQIAAKKAYDTLCALFAGPIEMSLPAMPAGAGNKPWRDYGNPFLPAPVEPLLAGQDGPIDLE